MLPFFRSLAAVCFYVLGTTFILAYVFQQRGTGGGWPLWWLQVADLPLLLAGIVFGGASVVLSVEHDHGLSCSARLIVAFPLIAFFLFAVYLTFRSLF